MASDIFFTLVVAFILYRVLSPRTVHVHRNTFVRNQQQEPRAETTPPSRKPTPAEQEGEYVDYEEIP
jgi:hypothetical protein